MPMRMPRFRVRTLMIAVAMVAVLTVCGIKASRLTQLSRAYHTKAGHFARAESMCADAAKGWGEIITSKSNRRLGRNPPSLTDMDESITAMEFRRKRFLAVAEWAGKMKH